MTAKRLKGIMSVRCGMPPHSLLQCLSNTVFQEDHTLLEDFLRTFPEVVR